MLGAFATRRPAARLRARALVACAALAALIALAGCGGGSGKVTKAAFIAKVDTICENEQHQMDQIALSSTKLVPKIAEALHVREQTLAAIEAVKSPPAAEAIAPEWLRARKLALSATRRIAASRLRAPEVRADNAVYLASSQRAQSMALAYGLTKCRGFASS